MKINLQVKLIVIKMVSHETRFHTKAEIRKLGNGLFSQETEKASNYVKNVETWSQMCVIRVIMALPGQH